MVVRKELLHGEVKAKDKQGGNTAKVGRQEYGQKPWSLWPVRCLSDLHCFHTRWNVSTKHVQLWHYHTVFSTASACWIQRPKQTTVRKVGQHVMSYAKENFSLIQRHHIDSWAKPTAVPPSPVLKLPSCVLCASERASWRLRCEQPATWS